MARYRKVDTRIWNDQRFNSLSDDGKLVFMLLLTHQHLTPIGAMRATTLGFASELHWSTERFNSAFDEIIRLEMVRFDESSSFLWLPNFIKYNRPESPNVVKSWEEILDYLPECPLKNELISSVAHLVAKMNEPFFDALPQAFRKAMPNQEQEQEQEQEQDHEQEQKKEKNISSGIPDMASKNNFNSKEKAYLSHAREILQFLNEKTGKGYREADGNLKLIIARLKSGATTDDCRAVIARKHLDWHGTDMQKYLRPATLFNAVKFEQYLGECVAEFDDDSEPMEEGITDESE